MKTASPKIGFIVHQTHDHAYCHLLFSLVQTGYRAWGNDDATIRFQSDSDLRKVNGDEEPSFPDWYGCRITIEGQYSKQTLKSAQLIDRLMCSLDNRKDSSGAQADWSLRNLTVPNFLWALENAKIPRCVYDGRVSEYVPVDKLLDPSLTKWGNQFDSVIAHDEKDARRKMGVKMATSWAGSLAEWVQAGSPVNPTHHDKAPTVEPIEEVIEVYFARRARLALANVHV